MGRRKSEMFNIIRTSLLFCHTDKYKNKTLQTKYIALSFVKILTTQFIIVISIIVSFAINSYLIDN